MDSKKELLDVEFTEECIEEMNAIYEYISNNLKEDNVARRLMTEVANYVLDLANAPELYMKIGKVDRLKRNYHRMVIKNYVVLYTVDFEKKTVYISHIIYGRRNYLNLL